MNEQALRTRLELLGAGPSTADWTDVGGRAERLQRRRTWLTIAVAFVAAVVVAAPTFAVATGAIDFWSAEPAPEPLRRQFDEMEKSTSPHLRGRTPTAHFSEARVVLRRDVGGIRYTLYVAPRKDEGFCLYMFGDFVPGRGGGGGSGGCPDADNPLAPLGMRLGSAEQPYLVYGSSAAPGATQVEVILAGGASERAELVWVSEPIDAGLYLLEVPARQEIEGFVARDAEGRELARRMAPNWNK